MKWTVTEEQIPYRGKHWWRENLANQTKYHSWQNKIWRIVAKRTPLFNELLTTVSGVVPHLAGASTIQ